MWKSPAHPANRSSLITRKSPNARPDFDHPRTHPAVAIETVACKLARVSDYFLRNRESYGLGCWAAYDETGHLCIMKKTAPSSHSGVGKAYFVRHGESTSNAKNIFAGVLDVPLTDFGRQQAAKVGKDIRNRELKFDAVYVSHLQRAKETCSIALRKSDSLSTPQVPIIEDRRLGERSFGIFAGCNRNLLGQTLGYNGFETLLHAHNEAPPRGEKLESIYFRAAEFYEEVIVPHLVKNENVLVVCHQYVLEPLSLFLSNKPPSSYKHLNLPNGRALSQDELTTFQITESSSIVRRRKWINDNIILYATVLSALGFMLGSLVRSVSHHPIRISENVFLTTIIVLLALTSFYSYLDIDLKSCRKEITHKVPFASNIFTVAKWLVCIVLGILLQERMAGITLWLTLFLLPPALTCPNYSLLWGGDLNSTALVSMLHSVAIPLLFPVLLAIVDVNITWAEFSGFYLVLLFGLAVPVIAAQSWRYSSPVISKRHAKEWKMIGILAAVSMGVTAGLYFTPENLFASIIVADNPDKSAIAFQQFAIAILLFIGFRVLFILANKAVGFFNDAAELTDFYILMVNPNVFLWASLAGTTAVAINQDVNEYVLFWVFLFYYFMPLLDQSFIVTSFTKGLLKKAMSASKLRLDMDIDDLKVGVAHMEHESVLSFLDDLTNDLSYLASTNNPLIDYRQLERKLVLILELISLRMCSLLKAERVTIFRIDRKNKQLRTMSAVGPGGTKVDFTIPLDKGIAGHVARTGELLRVDDPYSDPRFNSQTDLKLGFITRNIVCLPITSSNEKTIAVAQAINKVGIDSFTEDDVQNFIPLSSRLSAIVEKVINCQK